MEHIFIVWIYCRVTKESERYLLSYQRDVITNYFNEVPNNIIGINQKGSLGTCLHTSAMGSLRVHIRNKYQELKLFCEMHLVQIIRYQEIENQFQNSIFQF